MSINYSCISVSTWMPLCSVTCDPQECVTDMCKCCIAGGGEYDLSPLTPTSLGFAWDLRAGSLQAEEKVKKMKKLVVFLLCVALLAVYTGQYLHAPQQSVAERVRRVVGGRKLIPE